MRIRLKVSALTLLLAAEVFVMGALTGTARGFVWRPTATLEIGGWGQNLLHARHVEVSSQNTGRVSEISRSVLVRITKRF
jgi:hypothetical protein